MKFSDNRGFKVEFAKLENSDTSGCSFGNRPYNLAKNRFVNVPTYDKTRVILLEENRKPGIKFSFFLSDYNQAILAQFETTKNVTDRPPVHKKTAPFADR